MFLHSLRMRRRLLGTEHAEVAASYNNLANLLRKQRGETRGAERAPAVLRAQQLTEALYRRALEIRERRLGEESPQVWWPRRTACMTGMHAWRARKGHAAAAPSPLLLMILAGGVDALQPRKLHRHAERRGHRPD